MRKCKTCKKRQNTNEFYGEEDNYCKTCRSKAHKLWREKNRDKYLKSKKESLKKYKQKYPQRVKAVNAVSRLIKKGTIVRLPCEYCGKSPTEAHHENYDKPFDVIFLCRKHHLERHSKKLLLDEINNSSYRKKVIRNYSLNEIYKNPAKQKIAIVRQLLK